MANVTNVRQGEFMRVVYKLLKENSEGLEVAKILNHVAKTLDITDFELGEYPSSPGKPRYEKLVRFASIAFVKAGWLTKKKGKWFATEEGFAAYDRYAKPDEFFKEAGNLYQKWLKNREKISESPREKVDEDDFGGTAITLEEAQENAWNEITKFVAGVGPYEFQDMVADLLTAMGNYVDWVAPPGKDHGIDIVAYPDPLGIKTPRIIVQVKHRPQSHSTVKEIREFLSVIGSGQVGIFVSSGGFTKDALETSRMQELKSITLIDMETFFDLWVQNYSMLSQEAKHNLPLVPVYYLGTA